MPRYNVTWTEEVLVAGYIDATDERDARIKFDLGSVEYEMTLDKNLVDLTILGKRSV